MLPRFIWSQGLFRSCSYSPQRPTQDRPPVWIVLWRQGVDGPLLGTRPDPAANYLDAHEQVSPLWASVSPSVKSKHYTRLPVTPLPVPTHHHLNIWNGWGHRPKYQMNCVFYISLSHSATQRQNDNSPFQAVDTLNKSILICLHLKYTRESNVFSGIHWSITFFRALRFSLISFQDDEKVPGSSRVVLVHSGGSRAATLPLWLTFFTHRRKIMMVCPSLL